MFDDLEGRRTGERIQILRERKGLSRPVLAELVGMSESWLKGIERGTRLGAPPAEARQARRGARHQRRRRTGGQRHGADQRRVDPAGVLLSHPPRRRARDPRGGVVADAPSASPRSEPDGAAGTRQRRLAALARSITHRTDVGRILPTLVNDARATARIADDRRTANALLVDVYALVQHELVWASETEVMAVVADRGMLAAQESDRPLPLAGAAWTLAMVQRSRGDNDGALELVRDGADLLRPELENGTPELQAMYGALLLNAALTCARAGREGDALRYLDEGDAVAERLPRGYHHRGPSSASRTSRCTRCRSGPTCPSRRPRARPRSRSIPRRSPAVSVEPASTSKWRVRTTSDGTTPLRLRGCSAPTPSATTRSTTRREPARWSRASWTRAAR